MSSADGNEPSDAAQVMRAGSAASLDKALRGGARHIVVKAHIDLGARASPRLQVTTRSIRGNCGHALNSTTSDMPELRHGQCFLDAPYPFLSADGGAAHTAPLWLSDLYIRASHPALPPGTAPDDEGQALIATTAHLWMSFVTLEGRGVTRGVWAENAGLFAIDSAFIGFVTENFGSAFTVRSSSATFSSCSFSDNRGVNSSGVLNVRDASVRFRVCEFRSNAAGIGHDICIRDDVEVYTDVPLKIWLVTEAVPTPSRRYRDSSADGRGFLNATDAELVQLVQEQATATGMLPSSVVPRQLLDKDSDCLRIRNSIAILSLVGLCLLLVALVGVALHIIRRRRLVARKAVEQQPPELASSSAPQSARGKGAADTNSQLLKQPSEAASLVALAAQAKLHGSAHSSSIDMTMLLQSVGAVSVHSSCASGPPAGVLCSSGLSSSGSADVGTGVANMSTVYHSLSDPSFILLPPNSRLVPDTGNRQAH